jgi:hypothetical protein
VIEICTGQSSFDFTSSPKEKINLPNSASSTKVNLAMNKNKDNKNNQVVNQELKSNSPVQKDASNLCLSCAEVREKWPEFLVKIKKHNHSLSFVLQNCEPQAMDSGTLRLMFKYKFHQDRVNDESIKGLIEKTLAEVFGSGISLVSVLDENMEIKKYSSATSESGDVNSSDSSSTATNSVSSQQEMSATEQKVKEKEPNLLNNLLNAFGGEVIN